MQVRASFRRALVGSSTATSAGRGGRIHARITLAMYERRLGYWSRNRLPRGAAPISCFRSPYRSPSSTTTRGTCAASTPARRGHARRCPPADAPRGPGDPGRGRMRAPRISMPSCFKRGSPPRLDISFAQWRGDRSDTGPGRFPMETRSA